MTTTTYRPNRASPFRVACDEALARAGLSKGAFAKLAGDRRPSWYSDQIRHVEQGTAPIASVAEFCQVVACVTAGAGASARQLALLACGME